MKALLARIYTLPVFLIVGRLLFSMSRVAGLEPIALRVAQRYAWLVHVVLGKRPQETVDGLAQEWNRLMPTPRTAFPVIKTEDDTAYVEIRIRCPLRGSGDAAACWRAMAFDRELIEASGGQLVVMESQSVTGGECCKLAIRKAGADFDDLPVAHPRWREPSPA
ncbi:MAG: hypothetical protein AAFV53_34295 [Myxococcota bacterium]